MKTQKTRVKAQKGTIQTQKAQQNFIDLQVNESSKKTL